MSPFCQAILQKLHLKGSEWNHRMENSESHCCGTPNHFESHAGQSGKDINYPDILEQDLPYRSRTWVLSLIQFLELHYIGQRCLSDEFRHLNLIVSRFLAVIDFYEITLHANEMRVLNNLNVRGDGQS
jgi:hypothetical protein